MSEFTAPSVEELQERFPNHTIESFIAQGGMGAVYLATQTSLDRPVAIKILPQEFGEDADYRISFETEAKAMAKLNHSNLVGIYDFGDIDGMLFIIMEYIPGRSLFDIAHGQQVDQVESAKMITDMCLGLDHAHASGMLHRDIKPANVLIDDDGRPKIVDFGLARPLGEEQTDGVVFGTPGYTAPEVLTNPFAVDQRSDIFSMGVMLYEMLTGQLPGDPIMPASRVSRTDVRFDKILNKAIHPDPDQRYHTAGEMAEDLKGLIDKLEQIGGLINTGGMAQKSSVLGGAPTAGGVSALGGKPVVMSSKSGGNTGLILGLVGAVVLGVIAVSVLGGDDEPEGPTAAEIKAKQEREAEKIRLKEEQRMAAVAKKKREARELEEKKRRAEEQREARMREEKERKQALAQAARKKKEQLEKKEAARKLAMAEAEAKANAEEVPVYDHASFIAKERKDITVRAATVLRDHKDETAEILDREERDAKRAARRSLRGDYADIAEDKIAEFFADWKENEEKPNLPNATPIKVRASIEEFMAEIAKVDTRLLNGLSKYQEDYAKELRNKGRVLTKENVTASVEALKAELEALNKPGYFLAIVSGEDPSPDTFAVEAEEDKGGGVDEKEKRRKERERENRKKNQ